MNANSFTGIAALLFALANPIGVIPIFLGFTQRLKNVDPHRVIVLASITVAAFLAASALWGQAILSFFDVGLDDFRIAGGLLALFIAFEMFQAHYGGFMQTSDERTEAETDTHSIAITPLAFPLLVGPAEMSIMITLSSDLTGWPQKVYLVGAAALTSLLIAVVLWLALPINRLLGKTGINVVTRVMALMVAAIGIKFIMTGLHNAFPGLAR